MKKISFFKKLKLYFTYRKVLLQNLDGLQTNFNARVDRVSRIYTVLNIPKEIFDEPYNVRKSDIDNISRKYIKEYSSEISKFLDSIGLAELYDFYQVEKVDKYSYLLVFGYSLINTDKFARRLLFRFVPVTLLILSILLFVLL